LDEVSFSAGDTTNSLHVDVAYVNDHLESLVTDQDLSRYIL
jgi:ATP-dependent protease HslVU (ClpYQ) ATPase subunit